MRVAALSSSGSTGILCVGVASSIAGGTARELLRAFLAAHPDVELQVAEGSSREHIAAVRALRMDITFVVATPPAAGCEVEPLWSEPILVVLPEDHPLAGDETVEWSQLADERFIVSKIDPGPEIHDFVVKNMAVFGHHPLIEPRPVRRDGLMALVGLGRGVSLVGAAEAGVAYPGVIFRLLARETLPFSAVWSARNDNPMLRRFLSLARVQMRTLARALSPIQSDVSSSSAAPARTPDRSP